MLTYHCVALSARVGGQDRPASCVDDDGDDQRAAAVPAVGQGCHGFADQGLGLFGVDAFLGGCGRDFLDDRHRDVEVGFVVFEAVGYYSPLCICRFPAPRRLSGEAPEPLPLSHQLHRGEHVAHARGHDGHTDPVSQGVLSHGHVHGAVARPQGHAASLRQRAVKQRPA